MLKFCGKEIPFDPLTALVATGIALLIGLGWLGSGDQETVPLESSEMSLASLPSLDLVEEPVTVRPDPEPLARPHLDAAAEKCLAERSTAIEELRTVFAEARQRVPAFVEEARGLESKFRFLVGQVDGSDDHATFVRNKFESMVLSQSDLEAALKRSLSQFQSAITSLEGVLILNLRADIEDGPVQHWTLPENLADHLPSFDGLAGQTSEAIGFDLGGTMTRELVSYIVTSLAERIAIQGLLAAGVLQPEADRSWSQFGAEFLTNVLVDQLLIQPAYEAFANPNGRISAEIIAELDAWEQTLIEGDDTNLGWAAALTEYAERRAAWREDVLLTWLRNN